MQNGKVIPHRQNRFSSGKYITPHGCSVNDYNDDVYVVTLTGVSIISRCSILLCKCNFYYIPGEGRGGGGGGSRHMSCLHGIFLPCSEKLK